MKCRGCFKNDNVCGIPPTKFFSLVGLWQNVVYVFAYCEYCICFKRISTNLKTISEEEALILEIMGS